MKPILCDRKLGEQTILQLKNGGELTFTITVLTATHVVFSIEPSELIQRVMKVDAPEDEE